MTWRNSNEDTGSSKRSIRSIETVKDRERRCPWRAALFGLEEMVAIDLSENGSFLRRRGDYGILSNGIAVFWHV